MFQLLRSKTGRPLFLGSLILFSLGCRSATQTITGAATGAGVGALAGAILGNRVGKPLQGAAIGGAAGGVIGGAAGAAQDLREHEEERVADEHYQQTLEIALKNEDVLQMMADGQSEEVILNSVEKRLTYFDLSPEGLAVLKAAGASDRIIIAMQNSLRVRRPATLRSVR
jgi:outer membrane lipoprotein SlyB